MIYLKTSDGISHKVHTKELTNAVNMVINFKQYKNEKNIQQISDDEYERSI